MKRLNPDTLEPFKKGEVDARGYKFLTYSKTRINKEGFYAENWMSPDRQATLEALKQSAIRRVNETGEEFKRGDLDRETGERFFAYKKFFTKSGFIDGIWITEAEWKEYQLTKPQIPTIEEAQVIINSRTPEGEPRKLVIEVTRQARGQDSPRLWVKVICEEHYEEGHEGHSIRLNEKKPPACLECGIERNTKRSRRSISSIKSAVKKHAKKRGFPVTFVEISNDRKQLTLKCELHGEKIRSTKVAVNRGHICDECVDQSGENNPAFITIEEKRKRLTQKYPSSKCKILRHSDRDSKGRINVVCSCVDCEEEFTSTWGTIYTRKRETCDDCGHKRLSLSMIKPIEQVVSELRERGLSIVDEDEYLNSTHLIDIICNNCKTLKNIHLNQIFSQNFPCKCTLSIPNLCHALIFDDFISLFLDAKSNHNFGLCIADIWLPKSQHIIEVKYGDMPFGLPDVSNSLSHNRYLKTQQQLQNYISLNCKLSYVIIAKETSIWFVPDFPETVSVTYLDELGVNDFFSKVLKQKTIRQLSDLYRRPYLVRGMVPYDSVAKQTIRKKLRAFLSLNGLMLPTPKKLQKLIGYGEKRLDGALGLGRSVLRSDRVDACKYWFPDLYENGDAIDQWIPIFLSLETRVVVPSSKCYKAFLKWCETKWPLIEITREKFSREMVQKGFKIVRKSGLQHFIFN